MHLVKQECPTTSKYLAIQDHQIANDYLAIRECQITRDQDDV
jgi:hypothetical protein